MQERHCGPGTAAQNDGDEQAGDKKAKAKTKTIYVTDVAAVFAMNGLDQEIVLLLGAG